MLSEHFPRPSTVSRYIAKNEMRVFKFTIPITHHAKFHSKNLESTQSEM